MDCILFVWIAKCGEIGMNSRRRIPRHTTDRRILHRVHAGLDITASTNNEQFYSYMQNLSRSGILIVDNQKHIIRKKQKCKIIIPDKDNKDIELDAKVVWINDGRIGLSFDNLEQEIQSDLDEFLHRMAMESVAKHGMSATH
jgi:c-di-GMP-binding flagellar brake protein YcgR